MRRLAYAALPIAIGAVLQVSGLGGPTVTLIALLIMILIVCAIGVDWWLARRGASLEAKAKGWNRLGGELIGFIRRRRLEAVAGTMAAGRSRIPGAIFRRDSRAELRRLHETDTMAIFAEKFALPLGAALAELRQAGLVGEAEAARIAAPADPEAIEQIGKRLLDLSFQVLGPAVSQTAAA